MNGNPCKCIDCGGTEPGHSDDCTYMKELHGEQEAGDGVAKVAAEILFYANDEAQCWDAANQKWIIYRSTLIDWATALATALRSKQAAPSEGDVGMSDSAEAAHLAKLGFYEGPSTLSADIAATIRNTSKQAAGKIVNQPQQEQQHEA